MLNFGLLDSDDSDDSVSDSDEDGDLMTRDEWAGLAAQCARAMVPKGAAVPAPRPLYPPPAKPTKLGEYPSAAEVSTSAGETGGETSDSDSGFEAPPGLPPMVMRPPPGLESMAAFSEVLPPPGLGLPAPPGVV